jgi:hypothetical protein
MRGSMRTRTASECGEHHPWWSRPPRPCRFWQRWRPAQSAAAATRWSRCRTCVLDPCQGNSAGTRTHTSTRATCQAPCWRGGGATWARPRPHANTAHGPLGLGFLSPLRPYMGSAAWRRRPLHLETPMWRSWCLHNCRILVAKPCSNLHKPHPLSTFSSLLSRFHSPAMATVEDRGKASIPSSAIDTMDTSADGGQFSTPINNRVQNESKVTGKSCIPTSVIRCMNLYLFKH